MKTRDDSVADIFNLLQTAYTRKEVEIAKKAYKAHIDLWPEDTRLDLSHRFVRAVQALMEREELARKLGLTPEEFAYREQLLRTIPDEQAIVYGLIGAMSRNLEAERLRERRIYDLKRWLQRYPTDDHALSLLQTFEKNKLFEAQFLRDFKEVERQESLTRKSVG